ncbi:M20/M25/M40 family metallo-hydrolase [Aquihabitans sp. McL0605]|uniref:M20/M25/M40 family metallo-hydrolase n=1 Tax=Aquihabitans sp. McL0605 TaxID=3415671 RepID=UPI003CEA816D
MALDPAAVVARTHRAWDDEIQPALTDYIRVPALSPAFDPDWAAHGHLDAVVDAAALWAASRAIDGLSIEVIRLAGRTPILWFEVPEFPGDGNQGSKGVDADTVLLYGHLDKQPPMEGWREGLGPWDPVVIDDRLYGRGGADDGYAAYASLAAIEAVQAEGGTHARCIGLIECSEESGSPDLPAYVEHLARRIGAPSLVVCLDSFCGDYERMWTTTSLRGLLGASLTVQVLDEGVHSGSAGGVVPDSFRIARHLLDRVEDAATGRVLVPELWVEVPEGRTGEIAAVAADLGDALTSTYPYRGATQPVVPSTDPAQQLTAKTWEPTLTVIGADGLPPTQTAGNVLRPATALALSFRLPPTVDALLAARAVEQALTADPPHRATVTVHIDSAEGGWDAPPTAPWLEEAMAAASEATFGPPARSLGEGGSIPFMGMLGRRFPHAQFLLTGVLGPHSNAHGPNEFLHLPTARKLTAAVALVLDAHAAR